MNFVSEHGKMEDQEEIEKSLKKLQLNEDERLMTIVIENESIVCDMKILQQECDYFTVSDPVATFSTTCSWPVWFERKSLKNLSSRELRFRLTQK